MSVMSIRIDDKKRKLLKALASLEGRTMTDVVSQLLDEYAQQKTKQFVRQGMPDDVHALMKLSESAFAEWDNPEDAVYDSL
jgi:uncharacterized protein (DUF1778 family)